MQARVKVVVRVCVCVCVCVIGARMCDWGTYVCGALLLHKVIIR